MKFSKKQATKVGILCNKCIDLRYNPLIQIMPGRHLTSFSNLSMKAITLFTTILLIKTSCFAGSGDTTGTWVGTMEHKGTGVNSTVWYVKMDLSIKGNKCSGTITYDYMQRKSPLELAVNFKGDVLENTLVINYYSKDVKKIGRDARNILLQFRYNLILVKNKFTDKIYGDYVGLSKGLIPDKTKGYIYLEPYGGDMQTLASLDKKIDVRIDSLIAMKDKPGFASPQPGDVPKTLAPASVATSEPANKDISQPVADIKASTKKLPEKTTNNITSQKDTSAIVSNEMVSNKDSLTVTKNDLPVKKKEEPDITVPFKSNLPAKDTQAIVKNETTLPEKNEHNANTESSSLVKNNADKNTTGRDLKLDAEALQNAKAEVKNKLTARENIITDRVTVDTGDVLVEFYDNGTIDGDIITVIHNKAIALSNAMLSDKPLSFSFHIDPQNPTHEIVMYAENQGSIPPNTALMVISYKGVRKQVFLSADEKKSAVVLLELRQ